MARYRRDNGFVALCHNVRFAMNIVAGSVIGALLGSLLLGVIPTCFLPPALAVALVISAVKLARL